VFNFTNSTYGLDFNITYVPQAAPKAISEDVIGDLLVQVRYVSADTVRVRITDFNQTRWEVPDVINITQYFNGTLNYNITYTSSPFGLNITRVKDNAVIFNLDPSQPFQFDDQDLILVNNYNKTTNFYGLGERVQTQFQLAPGVYTTFNKDQVPVENGKPPGNNMYGSHPFYLAVDNDTMSATGGFLLNSNAMDTYVDSDYILFRPIGGALDFFGFAGPSIESVLMQYHSLIGMPALVPYWGLGWHQCRWGYANTTELQWVYNNYTANGLPLDVLWSDIDYMDAYKDFTVSQVNFTGLGSFVNTLHSDSKHYVPIIDAGIANSTNSAFTNGTNMNVFLQSPYKNGTYVGSVWPGAAVFVDWTHPNASTYWQNALKSLQSQVSFDGIWLDMNEASNFCDGECAPITPAFNSTDLPYLPGDVDLNIKNIDLNVTHYNNITEFDFHSLYGYYETKATNQYLTSTLGVRPFIISRSSFAGMGKYGQHWLGDNFSEWEYLEYSIIGIYNFQMFGIPFVGADICGFNGNTTAELCARWMQLGTLYPFSRNHNTLDAIAQEPYAFDSNVTATSNLAIRTRYLLLNYIYTLMFTHAQNGGVWFKPAFFEYPDDRNLSEIHSADNFMLGSDILVHPVLTPSTTSIQAYFPLDYWYDFFSGQFVNSTISQTITLNTTLPDHIRMHVRGGSIIPTLDLYDTVMNVMDLRMSTTTLIVALDVNGQADGRLIIDDGKSLDSLSGAFYSELEFSYFPFGTVQDILEVMPIHSGYDLAANEFPFISTIEIFGCSRAPIQISHYNGSSVRRLLNVSSSYDPSFKLCRIKLLDEVFTDSYGVFYISYS
jgi:alpha-glucosidase (family GH31 glycosyl hydrolase)